MKGSSGLRSPRPYRTTGRQFVLLYAMSPESIGSVGREILSRAAFSGGQRRYRARRQDPGGAAGAAAGARALHPSGRRGRGRRDPGSRPSRARCARKPAWHRAGRRSPAFAKPSSATRRIVSQRHFVILCFAARWLAGEPVLNEELSEALWIEPAELAGLQDHPGPCGHRRRGLRPPARGAVRLACFLDRARSAPDRGSSRGLTSAMFPAV